MSDQQQALAAAAVMSGEAQVKTIHFPLTGDPETDFISGIMAIFKALGESGAGFQIGSDGNTMAARVCEYLAKRFLDQHRINQSRVSDLERLMKANPIPPPATPWPGYVSVPPHANSPSVFCAGMENDKRNAL